MNQLKTLDLLTRDVARLLNVTEVDPDVGLADLGVDSLNVAEMIVICKTVYGERASLDKLSIDAYTTLRALDEQVLGITQPEA